MRQRRIQRELYWIAKLGTAHPLGLNDRIAAFGISGFAVKGETDEYNPYRIINLYPKDPKKRNRGKRNKKKCQKTDEVSLAAFKDHLTEIETNNPEKIECTISAKTRKFLSRFNNSHLALNLNKRTKFIMTKHCQYYNKAKPSSKDKPLDFKIDFTHKIMDDINFNSIFNSLGLKSIIPRDIKLKKNPQLIFK